MCLWIVERRTEPTSYTYIGGVIAQGIRDTCIGWNKKGCLYERNKDTVGVGEENMIRQTTERWFGDLSDWEKLALLPER